MEKPKVRLNIGGIILAEVFNFRKYFLLKKNNSMYGISIFFANILISFFLCFKENLPFIDKKFIEENSLHDFTQFLFKQKEIKFKKHYDAAMLMTGYTIKNNDNNKIKGG